MADVRELLAATQKMFMPFTAWIGEVRKASTLRADLIAGITVALVLVPQSMAYAQLAGLPPYIGLYASFIPVMIAAFMGSSRQLATGPVAVVSLLTAASLAPLAGGNMELYLGQGWMTVNTNAGTVVEFGFKPETIVLSVDVYPLIRRCKIKSRLCKQMQQSALL